MTYRPITEIHRINLTPEQTDQINALTQDGKRCIAFGGIRRLPMPYNETLALFVAPVTVAEGCRALCSAKIVEKVKE